MEDPPVFSDTFNDTNHFSKFENFTGTIGAVSAGVAYFIWLIIFIVLIWLLRAIGIRWFATIVFSLLISAIILTLIYPLQFINGKYIRKSEDTFFHIIQTVKIVLIIIYIVWKIFTDREDKQKNGSGPSLATNSNLASPGASQNLF